MMNVVWFEAKQGMTQVMTEPPADPYLHTVDIDTDEPGIISSKGKSDILRRKVPVPKVIYRHRQPMKLYDALDDVAPPVPPEKALADAEKQVKKHKMRAERQATRELKSEHASIDKINRREEQKRKRLEETPEERQERLAEMREKRAQNKKNKDAERASAKSTTAEEAVPKESVEEQVPETPSDGANSKLQNVSLSVQELLEAEATADQAMHGLLPQRIKARTRKTKFYCSPVPYDRHLAALEAAWPAQHVKDAFFELIPDDRIQVVQGPPGTGKTTALLQCIDKFPSQRILICATTNVGIANIYTRLVQLGHMCSLLMPQSRIPPGTPIVSQDPSNRIICSTISGRAGPILDAEKFDVVLVDEAAQCMEACFWGLIRPEVEHIVMVGDTAQLPALVSEKGQSLGYNRSLMQRLVEGNYPFTMLQTQRRMHPEIVAYPNQMFYEGRLQTEYAPTDLAIDPYMLYDVDGKCVEIGTSFVNEIEAEYCVKKALLLKEQTEDVVILCPYQAQARQILSLGASVTVHTIDSFQGREADVVILSMVRTQGCGFWTDPRRMCVALTRAKHGMYIVGSCKQWAGPLQALYADAKTRNVVR